MPPKKKSKIDTDYIRTDMFVICDKNLKAIEDKKLHDIYKRWIVFIFISMVIMIVLFVLKSRGIL